MQVGLIGCGAIATHAHLPALKSIDQIEVIGVADINLRVAQRTAKRFNIPSYYRDHNSMLKHEDIDTVVITAPTPVHSALAVDSAKAGKNIVIEKPLAMSLSECYDIKRAIDENNAKLTVIQNFRYFPSLRASRWKLYHGYYGSLLSFHGVAQTRCPTSWTRSTWLYHEKGVLLDFAPHLVDALLWLTSTRARSVYARGSDFTNSAGFLNYVNIMLELENGVTGFLETSWLTNALDFSLDFRGTGGRLKIDVLYDHYEEQHGVPTPLDDARNFAGRMKKIFCDLISGTLFDRSMKVYSEIYRDVVNGFEGGKIPVTIEDGTRSLAVLDASYVSIKEKRAVDIGELTKQYG